MKTSRLLVLLLPVLLLSTLLAGNGCSRGRSPVSSATPPPAPVPEASKPGSTTTLRFTTIRVNSQTERLELFLRDDTGHTFNRFERLRSWLAGRQQQLRFAMNAGMFQPDRSPVGLFVQDGKQLSPLNVANGNGNFFLKPNGVFLVSAAGPQIVESSEYPPLARGVRLATQSGPLLVRHGVFHPAITSTSTSRLIRNGVGISGDTIIFVISDQPVNFYELATFFRDELHCPDALYLDGVVSGLYSADLKRSDSTVDLGPIIAVVQ